MTPGPHLRAYEASDREAWDDFVRGSRNGTFLHARNYLEYHQDRFPDASVLVLEDNNLVGVLPATHDGDTLYSHRGLTYGGLVVGKDFHGQMAVPVFKEIQRWGREQGWRKLIYKPVPHIYHRFPAEEDLHALFCLGARLVQRNLSSAILLGNAYPRAKGRKSTLKNALKQGIQAVPSTDFDTFMRIDAEHLQRKHGVKPVHTAEELRLLAGRFPENIRLVAAQRDGVMLGGIITYSTDVVCHAQYIAASEDGKRLGALDVCIDYVLGQVPQHIRWFDFGISTLDGGKRVDEPLLQNKETWGARAVVYDQYELDL